MSARNITLREEVYNGYETLPNKGSTLSWEETDDNFVGLYQRLFDVIPLGAILPYSLSNAPIGWLVCDGSTIGNNNTAIYNGAVYQRIFVALWNQAASAASHGLIAYDNLGNVITFISVSGANAWTDQYYMTLPDIRGKFPMMANYGGTGLTPRIFETGGAATSSDLKSQLNSDLQLTLKYPTTSNPSTGYIRAPQQTISGVTTNSAGAISQNLSGATSAFPAHAHPIQTTVTLVTHDAGGVPVLQPSNTTPPYTVVGPQSNVYDSADPSAVLVTDADYAINSPSTHTLGVTVPITVAAHNHTVNNFNIPQQDIQLPVPIVNNLDFNKNSDTIEVSTVPPYFPLNWIIKYSYGV